jgi:DnaK suppressor protein
MQSQARLDLVSFRERLMARRAELERVVAEHHEEARTVDADPQRYGKLTRMDELQSQALAKDIERRRTAELQRITDALRRIDANEFGICVACGEEIGAKRLELDPTVATCIECARHGRA